MDESKVVTAEGTFTGAQIAGAGIEWAKGLAARLLLGEATDEEQRLAFEHGLRRLMANEEGVKS